MNAAFLGLGIMGGRMAANLAKKGFSVTVWNRTPGKAGAALAAGAREAATPAEAARQADILFTMLANPEAVEATALGSDGFLAALPQGSLWVDSSTVNPSFARRMAAEAQARGIRFLEAPVTGSKAAAENAQLVFLVGGDPADLEQVRPMMEAMSKSILHMGETGMGASIKMVNNMLAAQALLAFAEGLALGEALGFSREQIFEFFSGGLITAPLIASKRPKIETGDYEPDFPLQWMQKDLHLAATTAYEAGVAMPSANVAKEIYMLATHAGLGEDDFSAICQFISQKRTKG